MSNKRDDPELLLLLYVNSQRWFSNGTFSDDLFFCPRGIETGRGVEIIYNRVREDEENIALPINAKNSSREISC